MQNNSQNQCTPENTETAVQNIDTVPEEEAAVQPDSVEELSKSDLLGVVVNCKKLNVRETPFQDATILAVIPAGSEVVVDAKASTNDFYKICNAAGIQGFCIKEFIMLRG